MELPVRDWLSAGAAWLPRRSLHDRPWDAVVDDDVTVGVPFAMAHIPSMRWEGMRQECRALRRRFALPFGWLTPGAPTLPAMGTICARSGT
eukprot:11344437-Alexandrium_andersonii.AAC.1